MADRGAGPGAARARSYSVVMKLRTGAAVALILASVAVLSACAPGGEKPAASSASPTAGDKPGAGPESPSASADDEPRDAEDPTPAPAPTPTPTPTPVAMPTDCRAVLSPDVLAQMKDIPLNSPVFGESGVLADGSLHCIWGDPRADITRLFTTFSKMNRGPALDMLNKLADEEGFTCFTPDGGTRCEKTWDNPQYPVTDGRTLFWRDGLMIDTQYANMAPKGYTSGIVETLWG